MEKAQLRLCKNSVALWKTGLRAWKTDVRAWKSVRIRWKNGAPAVEYLWERLSKSGAARWTLCGRPVEALWIEAARCPE